LNLGKRGFLTNPKREQIMTDTTETIVTEPEAEMVEATEPTSSNDLSAEVEKWKAMSKKNEQRAKENLDKAKRFDEFEEANKTDMEKLLARAEAAEKAVLDASARTLRAEVAASKGVPLELLSGVTQEELEASADIALAFKGTMPKAATSEGAGNVGQAIGGVTQIVSRDQLKSMSQADINKARTEGRLDELMGKK
jgi:pyruvate/2-oxoglutarate dehydrogenase complex dihydrolipoamide acyltransferase (E2) component